MLGSWGTWISEQASAAAQIASETVNEIIAEGKEEFSGGKKKANVKKVPYCYWDVVFAVASPNNNNNETNQEKGDDDADDNEKSSSSVTKPITATSSFPQSKFWSANPMQWACLVKNGLLRDVNSFVISPEALIFESSLSHSSSSLLGSSHPNNITDDHDIKTALEKIINLDEKKEGSSSSSSASTSFSIKVLVPTSNSEEKGNNNTTSDDIMSMKKPSVDVPSSILPTTDSIRKMLKEDSSFADLRYDLVPKWVNENDFWRNFAFRVYLLAQTESVDQAMKILEIVNTEHRIVPPAATSSSTKMLSANDDDKREKTQKNEKHDENQREDSTSSTSLFEEEKNEAQQKEEDEKRDREDKTKIWKQIIESLPSDKMLLIHSQSQRFHSNRSLTKRGYGRRVMIEKSANNNNNDDETHSEQQQQLLELIHATGETESWQQHFTTRATKELQNVHSSVSMLQKLIKEVDDYYAVVSSPQTSNNRDNDNNNNEKNKSNDENNNNQEELPSLELIQSIAESCKFHKGRVGGLIGELQSAPGERVANHPEIDPDEGNLTNSLKEANEKLGSILVDQSKALKKLSEFAIAKMRNDSKNKHHYGDDPDNHENATTSSVAEQDDDQKNKNSGDHAHSPPSSSMKHEDENSEFVAKLPWEDDEEEDV